jgi:hypothetical protein
LRPYQPLVANPHLLTIAANFWPRPQDVLRFPPRAVKYQTEDNISVLVEEQRPGSAPKGSLVLVHGLEGSSRSGYMVSMAHAALERGWSVYRMNLRSCGGTESWSPSLYHSGLTSDLLRVVETLSGRGEGPLVLAGYSLGGNVVLKLAGELEERGPGLVSGVVAVSTPLDLAACVRRLEARENFIYEWRFVSRMKQRMRVRHRHWPAFFSLDGLSEIRTIYEIDDRITAPHFGFGSADNYYATQSSMVFLDSIRVPSLVIISKDDPLVPYSVYSHPAFGSNPHLHLLALDRGGHVSFLSRRRPRFWLDQAILDWAECIGNNRPASLVM